MVAQLCRWPQRRHATRLIPSRRLSSSRWEHLFSKPGSVSAVAAELRQLGKARSLSDGRLLHAHIRARSLDMYTFVGNCLIEMYANCGSLEDALHAFEGLPNPNVYSWNMLIKAYCQNGSVPEAFHIFTSMPVKDSVSWNTMISAFSHHGHSKQALDLFDKMVEERFVPNNISFISALDACANSADLQHGQDIHTTIIGMGYDQDVLIGTALLNTYGKCKKLHDAVGVFDKLHNRDIISWNAMISVFSQMNSRKEALRFFQRMLADGFKPDAVSFISMLEACAFEEGQIVHSFILESYHDKDVGVCTALVTMYGSNGDMQDALHVFQRMLCRTTVAWNAMIAVFTHNNHGNDALSLYKRMRREGLEPDKATFTSVIDACAGQVALEEGQDVHAAVIYCHHEEDTLLCNALISLYAECGSMRDAWRVFERMQYRDAVSWTAVINGSVQNGHHKQALCLFYRMQVEGFKPDIITFVSVLAACGRSGWLDEGQHFFVAINRDYRMCISGEHYLCLIYLLGRAGHLDTAEELIEYMPSEKAGMAWLSMLGSCKIHEDVERGLKAAGICGRLTPESVAPYVLLSNIIAADKLFEDID